jgi:hypothetical protein
VNLSFRVLNVSNIAMLYFVPFKDKASATSNFW